MSFTNRFRRIGAVVALIVSGLLATGLVAGPANATTVAPGTAHANTLAVGSMRAMTVHFGPQISCAFGIGSVQKLPNGQLTVRAAVSCSQAVQEIDVRVALVTPNAVLADVSSSGSNTASFGDSAFSTSCVAGQVQGGTQVRVVFGSGTPPVLTGTAFSPVANITC